MQKQDVPKEELEQIRQWLKKTPGAINELTEITGKSRPTIWRHLRDEAAPNNEIVIAALEYVERKQKEELDRKRRKDSLINKISSMVAIL